MSDLQALYQELILDHYRRPRNRGTLERPDSSVVMRNPLCGDEITLQIAWDAGRVGEVRFTGQGCSISQASASMMTQLAKGKTPGELHTLRERVRQMMTGDAGAAADPSLGDLRALSGVARFPVRIKCALMPWDALEEVVEGRDTSTAPPSGGGTTAA